MARIVMLYGESGSGKSASLRNFKPDEISVINITSKELPFKNKIPRIDNAEYVDIANALKNPTKKAYVIDDCGYLLSFASLRRASEKGFDKWNEIGENFFRMIEYLIKEVPNDIIVYLTFHEEESDSGKVKAKTVGKMLDNTLFLEGLFTIVIRSVQNERGYRFIVNEPNSTTKAPIGMFPEDEMDNDLKAVDTIVREYYDMPALDAKTTKTTKTKTEEK